MLTVLKIAGYILLGVLALALFDIVLIFSIAMIRVLNERKRKRANITEINQGRSSSRPGTEETCKEE